MIFLSAYNENSSREDKLVHIFTSFDVLPEINRVPLIEKMLGIPRSSQTESTSIMTIISLCSLVDAKTTVNIILRIPPETYEPRQ